MLSPGCPGMNRGAGRSSNKSTGLIRNGQPCYCPQLYGSKDTIREAFAVGLIEDGETWMEMIRDRNLSSHTYNIAIADAIVGRVINTYIHSFKKLQKTYECLAHEIKT